MKLSFLDLLKLKGSEIVNAPQDDITFAGVSIDSRSCRKRDLFFGIKGEKFDGHDYLKDVLEKGVKAAVAGKYWYSKLGDNEKRSFKKISLVLVGDTSKALGKLAEMYRKKFLIPVLAVAGSNGKTSTRDLIAHVLSKRYSVLRAEGNLNNKFGVPLTLFRLRDEHEFAVIELGANHFGEVAELCEISKPQFGIITNIGKEHLEFFGNLKGVVKAECELADWLSRIYGTFFLNTDDKLLSRRVKNMDMKFFSYGTGKTTDVSGRIVSFKGFYPEIELTHKGKAIRTRLNTIGSHSFHWALCAATAGYYFGIPPADIRKALADFRVSTPGRNQLLNKAGVWVIDDTYNSNPDSVMLALENMKNYRVKGKKHLVLADMLELGASSGEEHYKVGKAVRRMGFENLYTFGPESYNTYRAGGALKGNFYFPDKETLTWFLKLRMRKGDVVLVKGSRSMRMEEVVKAL